MTADDVWGSSPLDLGDQADVVRARALGWVPLNPAPLYRLVPAAWPHDLRAWLSDPSVFDDWHDDRHEDEQLAGLPPRPAGRVWLLRSPWPDLPVHVTYELLRTQVGRRDPHEIVAMYRAALDVVQWSQERAWQECSEETRLLIQAWRDVGRPAATIEELLEVELTPAELARWMGDTGLPEATVVEWLMALNAAPDEESMQFVREWIAAGLPLRPPRGIDLYSEQDPRDLRRWLDAGFDVDDAIAGEGDVALETAIMWRDAGFDFAVTQELLQLDRELTPDEALAFAVAGIPDRERPAWISVGFSAADAVAWTRAGLNAGEARLWRARGRAPDDVTPGHSYPPDLFPEPGYYPLSALDEIPDPPGTRGAAAQNRRAP